MSARNLTALGFSVGIGVITGSFSPCNKDKICQVLRNSIGVYIFKPTLQEQQKASEFWRSPGYVVPAPVLTLGPLVDLESSEAKMSNATDSINVSKQDLKSQPSNRQGQGQGQGQEK